MTASSAADDVVRLGAGGAAFVEKLRRDTRAKSIVFFGSRDLYSWSSRWSNALENSTTLGHI